MEEKALKLLRNAVVVIFGAALIAGIFVPVYTDEVGWRFQERAALDGVDKLFNDACGENTLAVPPLFIMPVRYFSAYMNLWFADPLYVRLSGILYALTFLTMVLTLIRRIVADRKEQAILGLFAVGLISLANMPMLLVMSRPEQPILLCATAALLLAFPRQANVAADCPPRAAWLRAAAIVALGVIAISYHVKGIILVPLFLACLYFTAKGRAALLPRVLAGVLLAGMTIMAYRYWSHRLDCPGDATIRAIYRNHNFGSYLTGIDSPAALIELFGKLIGNINVWSYGTITLPHRFPMSAWLPNGQVEVLEIAKWGVFVFSCWLIVAAIVLLCLLRALIRFVRERKVDRRIVFSLLLIALLTGWSALQVQRNVYEAIWIVPLLMLSFVLAIAAGGLDQRGNSLRTVLALFLGVAAIGSVTLIAKTWGPALLHASSETGYIAGQRNSVPVFGYSHEKPAIIAAARQCGIKRAAGSHSLMIDDLTYFAFMESRLPQHQLGVVGIWKGDITDPVTYLKSRQSDGAIVGCRFLPANLRRRARGDGRYCCLGPPNW